MHPSSCKDPACTLTYREHLVGISIASAAIPTRRPVTSRMDAIDRQGEKDATAYRALRKQGYQPPHVDGSHELQQRMRTPADIKPLGEKLYRKTVTEQLAP